MRAKPFGIAYKITCLVSGKCYVGITKQRPQRRWRAHIQRALSGERNCPALAAAIRKYGERSFIFEEIACASNEPDLLATEIALIAQEITLAPNGYNLSAGGQGLLSPSDETRLRMSVSHLDKKQSPELIEKRIAPLRGRSRDRAVVEQTAAKQRGRKRKSWGRHTDESKAKMSAKRALKTFSTEERTAMSMRMTGRTPSAETRAKMSETRRRLMETPEGQAAMETLRLSNIGHSRRHSEETLAKMRGKRGPNKIGKAKLLAQPPLPLS